MKQWKVGIFLFDEVEVLDFAGPFEVFAVTACNRGKPDERNPFDVCTFSSSGDIVKARNGLKITPDYSMETLPECEILVFPGGPGVRRILDNDRIRAWIADRIGKVEMMTSVCTGVYLLSNAGLLDGKRATTHSASIPYLRDLYPDVTAIEDVKYVDEGTVITSGGISAGIHMALHVVHRLLGTEIARDTAAYMEFDIDMQTISDSLGRRNK